ncbi:hypothetical protein RXV86_08770 [Alisedimentitalea sp. MJ-SS2]|uniref:hypothetical protein n=1 Tax=Aliisedimentitalea sp. MJ-SS2 TaxID=3049795 RepID=UPI00290EEEEA|nr:hypothetical protein [Alisedimentitalea sp. MJ-SS2]MDU8927473.1 hypothetical protein [Alisedimentitalea sp. MJ-SS2]
MSFELYVISRTNDLTKAKSDLMAFFKRRRGYKKYRFQYGFSAGRHNEEFLIGFPDPDSDQEIEAEVEDPANTIAWISINFFRSAAHYRAAANELQALLDTGKFTLYDPQEDEHFASSFPRADFVAWMSGIELNDLENANLIPPER